MKNITAQSSTQKSEEAIFRKIVRVMSYAAPHGIVKLGKTIDKQLAYHRHKRQMLSQWGLILAKNSALCGLRKNSTAGIIATGPSLNSIDLKGLKNIDFFSVSNAFLHSDIEEIKPLLHFFVPYHSPLEKQNFISWLRIANDHLPSCTNIVTGVSDHALHLEHQLFPDRNTYFLAFSNNLKEENINPQFPVRSPQTSPLMVLPLLIHMGYERVLLFGCDHNTLKNYRSVRENFYSPREDIRTSATDESSWGLGIQWELQCQARIFSDYRDFATLANQSNTSIHNCSKDSWLDFVPYLALESAEETHNTF